MKPVFTAAEMRGCDEAATTRYGVPGIVLMENAARGAVDLAEECLGGLQDKHLLFLCGRGNNGGDGYAMARHALNRGARATVLALAFDSHGDAEANLTMLRAALADTTLGRLDVLDDGSLQAALDTRPDLLIDALLGTGLTSALHDPVSAYVRQVNDAALPVLAVDIPTGVNSDTGEATGGAIMARWTAAMGGLKRGHLFADGRNHSGITDVIDIGMPRAGYYSAATSTWLIESGDVAGMLPRRAVDAHKYAAGSVCIAAGSYGMTGAAALAGLASLRAGAGISFLATPAPLHDALVQKLTEVILCPMPATSGAAFARDAVSGLLERMRTSRASAIGPGISRDEETQACARELIGAADFPLVIDADALYALTGHLDVLAANAGRSILTPHAGEFQRLSGMTREDVSRDPVECARSFARAHGCTLLLKGAPTVIATADGRVFVNSTGNPGMATAGSGDVLTGLLAGFLAQGLDPVAAAICGAFVHGQAGDRSAAVTGIHSLIAGDILDHIPETLRLLTPSTA
ncbi:MAG: NAD(P)H-hydrate dehydratase [Ignavibacteriae bacterium]|nr:NAD(P)H-hydrate dehydratase [Ignavibacteriota bacterium]